MARNKHNWVWVNGQWRPAVAYREIKRGRSKGKLMVLLPDGAKRVVRPEALRRKSDPAA
jgi:hypothetical protein